MIRKDCDSLEKRCAREGTRCLWSARTRLIMVVCVAVPSIGQAALGSTIRVWPSATVTGSTIRIDDVCDLSGYRDDHNSPVGQQIIAESPTVGGSRIIHIDLIRSTLAAAGTNLATVRLFGATHCEVARPAVAASSKAPRYPSASPTQRRSGRTVAGHPGRSAVASTGSLADGPRSLRQTVIDYFAQELARYGGRVELTFDDTSAEVLALAGPSFSFSVHRAKGKPIGLTSVEVEIRTDDQRVQFVPLVVRVRFFKDAVVARRSINLGATIGPADLRRVETSFSRLDQLGLESEVLAVGQRAKRFIPAGTLLASAMIESVPLVVRGQLVNLVSVAGGVRIVTSAKAAADGLLGAVIRVRSTDNRKDLFDGVVTGPGEVRIGTVVPRVLASAAPSEFGKP